MTVRINAEASAPLDALVTMAIAQPVHNAVKSVVNHIVVQTPTGVVALVH